MPFEFVYEGGDILSLLCLKKQKWGLFLLGNDAHPDELLEAAPFTQADIEDRPELLQVLADYRGYFFFDSEAACYDWYNRTVGDDDQDP